MNLTPGFHEVPRGHLATIVTHLEMSAKPAIPPVDLPVGLSLRRVEAPDVAWYRELFRRVGGDWLWTSRLLMPEAELAAILADRDVEVWALVREGADLGLLELDFRSAGACELAFLGVSGELQGGGVGRALMAHATERAWGRPIRRFHVHTCTHDHPGALGFYRRSGFVPVRQQVEVIADPRLSGLLPSEAAPHVPRAAEMDAPGQSG